MLIDVKDLTLGSDLDYDITEDVCADGHTAKVHTFGKIYNTKEGYVAKGQVDAVLDLNCDLCLDTFQKELSFDFDEIFSDKESDNDEVWDFSDKVIDLEPAVIADILLNMPMKAVCSDDCKGLCPICGKNLNQGDCHCEKNYVDPRFEKLLDLFKENKEV